MNNYKSITSFAKIKPIEKLNDKFTLAECAVCACGRNRNFFYIAKETIEQSLYGLDYLPIVAHLIKKEDGSGYYIGGHDYTLEIEGNEIKYVPETQIVGCVMADSYEFKEIEEFGKTVLYLVCKCILYTEHVPNLMDAVYDENTWFNQSAEIEIGDTRPLEEDSNFCEILSFKFLKLCLLGLSDNPSYNTEPCFISSKVKPVTYSLDENQSAAFEAMLNSIMECFSAHFDKCSKKGGKGMNTEDKNAVDQIDAIAASENVANDDKAVFSATDNSDASVPVDDATPIVTSFALSYNERREAIANAMSGKIERDEDGNTVRETFYYLIDFDDKYAFAEKRVWTRDDELEISYVRVPYTEVENKVEIGSEEPVFLRYLSADELKAVEAAEAAKDAELNELREFKRAADKAEVESVLESFADISETAEFAALKEHIDDYANIEDVKKECFAIRGMNVKVQSAPTLASTQIPTLEKKSGIDEFVEAYRNK